MPERNLFILRFNGRNDNLGDQFIFRALADSLAHLGKMQLRGTIPDYLCDDSNTTNHWLRLRELIWTKLHGGKVFSFAPPGGRLWTGTTGSRQSARQRFRKWASQLIPVSRVAIGVSVIPSADHAWCDDYRWIGVRDHESLAALHNAGFNQAEYFPDLSFLPDNVPSGEAKRNKIALSFRRSVPELRDSLDYTSNLVRAVDTTIGLLSQGGKTTSFFYQVDEDSEFNDEMATQLQLSMHRPPLSLETYASYYASTLLVVSNRLHCLLIGAACGAIPIALTSRRHTKVTSLFRSVGWESLVFNIDEIDDVRDRLDHLFNNLAAAHRLVEESFESQRKLGLSILSNRFDNTVGASCSAL